MYDIKNDPVFKNDPMIKSEEDIYIAAHVAHEEFYGYEEQNQGQQNQQDVNRAFNFGKEAPTLALGFTILGIICWIIMKIF